MNLDNKKWLFKYNSETQELWTWQDDQMTSLGTGRIHPPKEWEEEHRSYDLWGNGYVGIGQKKDYPNLEFWIKHLHDNTATYYKKLVKKEPTLEVELSYLDEVRQNPETRRWERVVDATTIKNNINEKSIR